MIDIILENATPLLWGIGLVYFVGMVLLWSCLAMPKRCEEEA